MQQSINNIITTTTSGYVGDSLKQPELLAFAESMDSCLRGISEAEERIRFAIDRLVGASPVDMEQKKTPVCGAMVTNLFAMRDRAADLRDALHREATRLNNVI